MMLFRTKSKNFVVKTCVGVPKKLKLYVIWAPELSCFTQKNVSDRLFLFGFEMKRRDLTHAKITFYFSPRFFDKFRPIL